MIGQKVERAAFSMFSKTPIYEVEEGLVFGLMTEAVIADPTDVIYVVTQAGERRFDLISRRFYGTPHLWWVIAMVNGVSDVFLGVPYGTKLRIPTRERLAVLGILNN